MNTIRNIGYGLLVLFLMFLFCEFAGGISLQLQPPPECVRSGKIFYPGPFLFWC